MGVPTEVTRMVPIATFMDDWLTNGKRNPVKKWWFDHELVNGVAVTPKGTNQRDIDPARKVDPALQKMAVYNANMMPPPNESGPVEVDRKAAMGAVSQLETPGQARKRIDTGMPMPTHYVPTPPIDIAIDKPAPVINPYK